MKTYLLSGAAFLALSATSAFAAAPPPVSGTVGLFVGADWTDFTIAGSSYYGGDDTVFLFGGDAHVNAWVEPGVSVQFDVQGDGTTSIDQNHGNSSDWDGRTGGIFGAHVSWRDPNSHLLGVFGGFSAQSNLDYDGTMSHGIVGVEGQYYWDHATLYGQAGYMPLMSNSDYTEPKGIWFLRGVGRYFWTENDKLELDVSYGGSELHDDGGADARYWNAGVSWQHRFRESPFSTTVAYSGFWGHSSGIPGLDNDASENALTFAINISFGTGSLQQIDRDGETLDMPDFRRAEAWTGWLGWPDN